MAEDAEVAVTQIVGEDQDDIRRPLRLRLQSEA
jgi:hypothetical protein